MKFRAFVPAGLLWAAYGVAYLAGCGRAADVLVGGQTEPMMAAGGLVFLCLRLLAVSVAPVLALGALIGYVVAAKLGKR